MTTLCHVTNREQSSLHPLVRKIKSGPVGFTPLLQRVTLQKHLRHKLDRETEVIHWEVNRWWKKTSHDQNITTRDLELIWHVLLEISESTRLFFRKYKTLLPEVQLFYRKYKTLLPEVQDSFTGSTRSLEIHFLPGIFDGFHWSTLMTKYDQKQKFFDCECTVHQSIFLQYKHWNEQETTRHVVWNIWDLHITFYILKAGKHGLNLS